MIYWVFCKLIKCDVKRSKVLMQFDLITEWGKELSLLFCVCGIPLHFTWLLLLQEEHRAERRFKEIFHGQAMHLGLSLGLVSTSPALKRLKFSCTILLWRPKLSSKSERLDVGCIWKCGLACSWKRLREPHKYD